MIASGVSKEFGVLAADSAMYETESGKSRFDAPKLSIVNRKYLLSYIGTPLYFHSIDLNRFNLKLDELSLYLQKYLRESKPDIADIMKEKVKDEDENKPHFCLYVMGIHGKHPTLAQFNSFEDFKPKYLWSDNGLKFSTILYGDDSQPEKQKIFKESTVYMENLSKRYEIPTPGIVSEILTRGIYKKADLEEEIGLKKKYAGGTVCSAYINKEGGIYPLSFVEDIYGSIESKRG